MIRRLRVLWGGAWWSLALKELRQIRRDRRLVLSLVVPPTLQILLFGLVLDPQVRDLRLGVVDESRTAESRELVAVFAESRSFQVSGDYRTPEDLDRALRQGRIDAGVVIPANGQAPSERPRSSCATIPRDGTASVCRATRSIRAKSCGSVGYA